MSKRLIARVENRWPELFGWVLLLAIVAVAVLSFANGKVVPVEPCRCVCASCPAPAVSDPVDAGVGEGQSSVVLPKWPTYRLGLVLRLRDPLWVEAARDHGDLRRGDNCVAWTSGTLTVVGARSNVRWLVRYANLSGEEGGTLCPDNALVVVAPADYAMAMWKR
jgi:hypothetical protein